MAASVAINGQKFQALLEIKDIATKTSVQACLFQPNAIFSTVLKNNKIVFFTGEGGVKNKFDIYDIDANTWSIGMLQQKYTVLPLFL
ncbi:MAG: hypothetical protein ACM3H8_05290 [Sphingobacteriales bacterium]